MSSTADRQTLSADRDSLLSVVIPLGPGDQANLLAGQLKRHPCVGEVILSTTAPAPHNHSHCTRWISGSAGRGAQLNRGAANANGPWLWFIHADSQLSDAAIRAVGEFTTRADAAIGYCRLRFIDDGPWLVRLNACGANLRSRLFRQPYGDQGLCMPANVFNRLGGFREDLERGEDLDFIFRAHLAGIPIRCTGATILTSARRYREHGWLRTTWRHQIAAARLIRNARRAARSDRP